MQPLYVAQSGSRSRPGCRHRIRPTAARMFAHPGTCSKQPRQFHSIESCTSVLTQAVRATVVDVWCYRVHSRPPSGRQRVPPVRIRWLWDRPTLERATVLLRLVYHVLCTIVGTPGSGRGRDWSNVETAGARLLLSPAGTVAATGCLVLVLGQAMCVDAPHDAHSYPANAPVWRHSSDETGCNGLICARSLAATCLSRPRYRDQRPRPKTSASHRQAMAAVSVASQSPASR